MINVESIRLRKGHRKAQPRECLRRPRDTVLIVLTPLLPPSFVVGREFGTTGGGGRRCGREHRSSIILPEAIAVLIMWLIRASRCSVNSECLIIILRAVFCGASPPSLCINSSVLRRRQAGRGDDPGGFSEAEARGGGGGGGSKDGKAGVDNVLAALVGFSHDPTLWHFVHSVVDELDYSRRAASRSPPQRHLPASHLSDARLPESHHSSGFWPTWGRGAREEKPRDAQRPAAHHPDSSRPRPRDGDEGGNGGNDTYSDAAHHLRGGRGRAYPSTAHPPTFIFHKVYINTHYDTHTRQPYHRPVLAVAALANETTPTSSTSAATLPSTAVVEADTTHGPHPQTMGAGVSEGPNSNASERELPDRLETFTGVDESRSPEEPGRGAGAGVGEGAGGVGHPEETSARWRGSGRAAGSQIHPGVWREVGSQEGQRAREAQQTLGLDTFKGQLKFLKRWEKRLWRRGLLHRSHHLLRREKASGSSVGQREVPEEEHVALEDERHTRKL
ncbi:uncharacterized protein LOC125028752 [Penaeus chinensis]|uniref:uncharacterized protein LOC125028752 n=1 Tax=Penaeus chinensis TaxID=139456 RepID=UPI001FB85107|nr:uncharacterized protein LOC125028752 [Penaeus chinensis]